MDGRNMSDSFECRNEDMNRTDNVETIMKLKELRHKGNGAYLNDKMHDAITLYTLALQLNPRDSDILSNRGAAYTRVRDYEKARDDLMKAIFIENKPNFKTLHRLCKALWALRRYSEVEQCLKNAIASKEWQANRSEYKQLLILLTTSKRMQEESIHGKYNMLELFQKQKQIYDCGEYQGAVTIQGVKGKGLGLIATEKIPSGTTFLATKAFAIVFPCGPKMMMDVDMDGNEIFTNVQASDALKFSDEELHEQRILRSKLLSTIEDILNANPSAANDFYSLYGGDDLKRIVNFQTSKHPLIDKNRIRRICELNGVFSVSNPNPTILPKLETVDETRNCNTYGIWILPSFANHSCVDINCDMQKYGDFMIMRSTKDIDKGEEILVTYINPSNLYHERKEHIEHYGFTCTCRLCLLEAKEPVEVHEKRRKCLCSFLETVTILGSVQLKSPKYYAIEMEKFLTEIKELRKHNQDLNLSLLWIYRHLGSHYIRHKKISKGTQYLESAYSLTKNTVLVRDAIRFAIDLTFSYQEIKDVSMMRKWLKILAKNIVTIYGTIDVLPLLILRENVEPHKLVKLLCRALNIDDLNAEQSVDLSTMLKQILTWSQSQPHS